MSSDGLLSRLSQILRRREASGARRRLSLATQHSVDFSSNDFLSLSTCDALRETFLHEFSNVAHLPLGSGGSRLLDGNSLYAEQLERDIAAFHGAPTGLLFNSGFDANSGMFACLPLAGDVVIYDEFIHASVHEGMRLSRAGLRLAFAHNSYHAFERLLSKVIQDDALVRQGKRNVFVAVETVYSMDGDVAPILALLEIKDRLLPLGNCHLIVDEAHATGVFGPQGRGIVSMLGVEERVLARLHTFGKALSSGGAIVLCDGVVREYLINYARSLIYTTALGLPTLVMIRAVYRQLMTGETEPAQQRLRQLIHHLHLRLQSLSELPHLASAGKTLTIPSERPRSPIFSLLTPSPRELAAYCQAHGFVLRAIVPPTVPDGGERVRVCLHAGNTVEDVNRLVECLRDWLATGQAGAHL